jgi:hypothetical protein
VQLFSRAHRQASPHRTTTAAAQRAAMARRAATARRAGSHTPRRGQPSRGRARVRGAPERLHPVRLAANRPVPANCPRLRTPALPPRVPRLRTSRAPRLPPRPVTRAATAITPPARKSIKLPSTIAFVGRPMAPERYARPNARAPTAVRMTMRAHRRREIRATSARRRRRTREASVRRPCRPRVK